MIDRPANNDSTLLSRLTAASDALTSASTPEAAMAALDVQMKENFGHILFTILRFDRDEGVMRRLYSNREDVSPTRGTKPITDAPWMQQVFHGGQSYIGRTREDLKSVFFDYESLWAIGCGSVLNTPISWQGKVVGTLNSLDVENHYNEDDARLARLWAQLAVPLLLV